MYCVRFSNATIYPRDLNEMLSGLVRCLVQRMKVGNNMEPKKIVGRNNVCSFIRFSGKPQ